MVEGTSRAEHVTWCKERALEYVGAGDLRSALASLQSDLRKHPATARHAAIDRAMSLAVIGDLDTAAQMRTFIEGIR